MFKFKIRRFFLDIKYFIINKCEVVFEFLRRLLFITIDSLFKIGCIGLLFSIYYFINFFCDFEIIDLKRGCILLIAPIGLHIVRSWIKPEYLK